MGYWLLSNVLASSQKVRCDLLATTSITKNLGSNSQKKPISDVWIKTISKTFLTLHL